MLPEYLPSKVNLLPVFDARLWQVPNIQMVFNTFLWRWLDAKKNSVSMYASSIFSVKELNGKKTHERKSMLFDAGHSWEELENKFKLNSKENLYTPKIKFAGSKTECFTSIPDEFALEFDLNN